MSSPKRVIAIRLVTILSDRAGEGWAWIFPYRSLQEGTDTTAPQGKLVFSIMAGLAEEFDTADLKESKVLLDELS